VLPWSTTWRPVGGVDRGVGIGGRLAVTLRRLDAIEGEIESTDLLRVLESGGLECDHLLRYAGELGGHRGKWRQLIHIDGQVVELGAQVGDRRRQSRREAEIVASSVFRSA
jgi:hypothetical protein